LRVLRRSAEIVTQHSGAPCAEAKGLTWVASVTLSAARIVGCSTWNIPEKTEHAAKTGRHEESNA
jgi:hypothetical protein